MFAGCHLTSLDTRTNHNTIDVYVRIIWTDYHAGQIFIPHRPRKALCHFCRCHFWCVLFCCNFRSMTRKRSSKNFEDRTKFFLEPLKKFVGRRRLAAPPPSKIDRRAAADTMTSAQGSSTHAQKNHVFYRRILLPSFHLVCFVFPTPHAYVQKFLYPLIKFH